MYQIIWPEQLQTFKYTFNLLQPPPTTSHLQRVERKDRRANDERISIIEWKGISKEPGLFHLHDLRAEKLEEAKTV